MVQEVNGFEVPESLGPIELGFGNRLLTSVSANGVKTWKVRELRRSVI